MSNEKAFLIVKMSAIGDILQSLPVAQYIKIKYPTSHLTWVVEEKFKELVASSPYIDAVISVDFRSKKGNFFKFLACLPA